MSTYSTDYSDEIDSPGSPYGEPKMTVKQYKNKIAIGQIQLKTFDREAPENGKKDKIRTKDIVFNVKSLKALQNNIGVFSV